MTATIYHEPKVLREIPHDRHSVIEASAGTGKTYAIEHLVLDLLLRTDSSIDQILVVTFTEKATEELRSRIRTLLENVLSGSSSAIADRSADRLVIDDAARRKLETALFSFDSASIYTIHAFCLRMLTDLAFDTGTSFGLRWLIRTESFIAHSGRSCARCLLSKIHVARYSTSG